MNNDNPQPAEPDSVNKRAIKYLLFYLLIGLAITWVFNRYLSERHNPNQQPHIGIDSDGIPTVTLRRNPYGHYVSNGKINDQDVQFLLDTGATEVSIPIDTAKSLGLKKGAQFSVSTANGIAHVYATRISSIEIGNIKLYNINAHINPNVDDDDILLGMSFLKHLEFTQRGKLLTLRQVPLDN